MGKMRPAPGERHVEGVVRQDGVNTAAATCTVYGYSLALPA